ncbi:hypothetical protein DP73_18210 [Desulfosporosinus sp. HMP52]|uniref:hypothetical protein n=1 Tax=Desulfosporosinus sp. HMP52 TaxID=1487923 RepID=UPI00051FD6FB|nr:hypothetical protein [Desulfosporosinus sp. HMP52]KGK85755.1 hypothetical protein DP73_18210 [Desulfosporosinus sp. HMP52]
MSQRIVDIIGFKEDLGLDCDTLKDLYTVFVEELIQERERVNSHVILDEVELIRKSVHNIKGIASSYRTELVFESAKDLDFKLKHRDFEELSSFVADLNKRIDEAVKEIRLYFGER